MSSARPPAAGRARAEPGRHALEDPVGGSAPAARIRFQPEPWWLDSQELNAAATQEQDDRYQGDAWEDPIRQYLENEVRWSENSSGEHKPHYVPRPKPLNDTSV